MSQLQDRDEDRKQPPPPLVLPPLRTFVVRKVAGYDKEEHRIIQEITVVAHMMQVADARTVKFIDIEDFGGDPMPVAHRVFFDVEDVEEVMRKTPAGLITH